MSGLPGGISLPWQRSKSTSAGKKPPVTKQTNPPPGPPPRPARAGALGLNVHQIDERALAACADLGVRRVRYTLYTDLYRTDPAYRERAAADLARAEAAGLDLLCVVHEQSGVLATDAERLAAQDAFGETVLALVKEYPRVAGWQLWNEMEGATFTDAFGGKSGLPMRARADAYGEHLRRIVPKLKAANPKATIVTGGIASVGAELRDFLAGIAGAPYDVLAVHVYSRPLTESLPSHLSQLPHDRPVWLTEFGVGAWLGENIQESELPEAHRAANGYDRDYVYCLWTGETRDDYALLRPDGTSRPAYQRLRTTVG